MADDSEDDQDVDDGRAMGTDSDAVRWRQADERFAPRVAAALAAGRGDTARLQAIWRFAQDKAVVGQHGSALAALRTLLPLLGTAPANATMPAGDATADDARDGRALLERLKAGFQTYKDAFALLPERAGEGTRLIRAVPDLVRANDLEAATAALARLDAIVADAARHLDARVPAAFGASTAQATSDAAVRHPTDHATDAAAPA